MSDAHINDQDETVVSIDTQEDDPSEQNKGLETEGMEEVNDITCEEKSHNIIKMSVNRRTNVEDEENDEDETIANALKKVES